MKVFSFDVFDTLLIRDLAAPADVFRCLGVLLRERGLLALEANEFAQLRVECESISRGNVESAEVRLEEIYRELAMRLRWDEVTKKEAMGWELDQEASHLHGVPAMKLRLEKLRQKGWKIVFLSDMYLPSQFLFKILLREGIAKPHEEIWVSGDCRASKGSGALFRTLQRHWKEIECWRHQGDHPQSDCSVPKRFGIAAEWDRSSCLSRYERTVAELARRESALGLSRLVGSMRLARLEKPCKTAREAVLWRSGTNVVGPILFGFVQWCVQQAQERGLKRLYFVARDGQILHRIASILLQRGDKDLESRYLYGGRQAWHPASIEEVTKNELDWVFAPTRFLSVDQVCARLGLNFLEVDAELAKEGVERDAGDKNLEPADRERLREVLTKAPLKDRIREKARQRREWVLGYLRQEGFIGGPPSALVDIGWFGNLQRRLEQTIALSGNRDESRLIGLYFGLLHRPEPTRDQDFHSYWCTPEESRYWLPNLGLLEMFTAADHGPVLGYQRAKDNSLQPLLEKEKNDRALDWGLELLQEGVMAFARHQTTANRDFPISQPLIREATKQIFHRFYYDPDAEEAGVWGEFSHSEDQVERNFQTMIPSWKTRDLLLALVDHRRRPTFWWPEGMQAINPSLLLRLFISCRNWKRKREVLFRSKGWKQLL